MTDNSNIRTSTPDRDNLSTERGSEPQGMVGMLSSLLNDVTTLVRQEIALGKAEMQQNIKKAGAAIGSMVVAGAVLNAGFLVLLAAAVFGLSHVLDPWLSALIVGAIVVIIGASMLKKARNTLSKQGMAPDRTMESMQRDQEMLKEHTARDDKESTR